MTQTDLIVARMDPAHARMVAELFAESDQTELPDLVGVRKRTLLAFHDLYFHLIEADTPVAGRVRELRAHPLFSELNVELSRFIQPYHPSWREPSDAMAVPFYHWSRS